MAEEIDFTRFITGFYKAVKDSQIKSIQSYYDSQWNRILKSIKDDLPQADKFAHLVDNDEGFLFLYKDLYFRHLYSHHAAQISLVDHRVASWENYTAFFDYLLNAERPIAMDLPIQWLWDIIDEFIYQYQEFCHFRSKNFAEVQKLENYKSVWNTVTVLKYLYRFVQVSDIVNTLQREKTGSSADASNLFAVSQMYSFLGYFSIIGLCRMHCMLGDYFLALKVLSPIELCAKNSRSGRSPTAYISLYYYAGFAYMMVRQYQDAIKTFQFILTYINTRQMKQHHNKQYDQRKNDQMYSLLAVLLHIAPPRRMDEQILTILREEHSNKLLGAQQSENQDPGSENFTYSCPKFVSPSPDYDEESEGGVGNVTLPVQKKLFLKDIHQALPLTHIGSYLKLYTTIHCNKLASLLEQKPDTETLRMYLLRYVLRNIQVKPVAGSSVTKGNFTNSDVDFYLEGDMIHVMDNKVTKNYADIYIKHCATLDDIRNDIEKHSK